MNRHRTLHESEVLLDVDSSDPVAIVKHVLQRFLDHAKIEAHERDAIAEVVDFAGAPPIEDLGHGVGVMRVKHDAVDGCHSALVRLHGPLAASDGASTHVLWVVFGPGAADDPSDEELEPFGWMLVDDRYSGDALAAGTPGQLLEVYERYLKFIETPPPSAATGGSAWPEELTSSGRLCGGLRADIARRWACYGDDIRDGMHPKALSSAVYLFFACFAPAVAFGGLSAVLTHNEIGAVETIVGTAVVGIVYALVSGMPLTLLGSTGPVVVFTGMLYTLCAQLGVPFLPSYAWVGLWTMAFLLALAIFEASELIRYFSRFTDEIFAGLMSLIFIVEAVKDIVGAFDSPHRYDTALLSLILALGTFYIATTLKRIRRSPYLVPAAREFLADFGPMIAILIMTGVSVWLHPVELETLAVPARFSTTSGRAWTVDLFAAPTWMWIGASVPALLLSTLLFFDQNITTRLVSSADYKLKRGAGYHLDMAAVALLVGLCALFGLPFMVAATVRSLNHVRSLCTVETHGGSEVIVGTRENRVSALLVHVFIGLSLLRLDLLQRVPMSVLFGLFLFMGFASMSNSQLFQRALLWVTDPRRYPPSHYIRRVPTSVVHAFTAIQALCLAVLWAIKVSAVGLFFPLFIALLVPIRMALGRFFDPLHLAFLDADEAPAEEEFRDLD